MKHILAIFMLCMCTRVWYFGDLTNDDGSGWVIGWTSNKFQTYAVVEDKGSLSSISVELIHKIEWLECPKEKK